ncbi:MAG: hypothetical protein JNM14_09980 [Ferruginibacter sp.]|nr:hypothetical protein [Ferruginibacter sp.]
MKYFFCLLLFFCNDATSQSVAINTDGSTAATSALLDIKSTAKGLLIPRMTKTQKNAIATPATGLLVFQTGPDSVGFHYYSGSVWLWLNPATESNDWKITGNTGTDTAVNFIGTTSNMPLRFKQNNIRMGQLDNSKGSYYFGKRAGFFGEVAVGCIGIGDSALKDNSTGINNTAIGTNALDDITTGSNNTAIGYRANVSSSRSNSSAIGAFAHTGFSNSMVLGSIKGVNGATSNVQVGIGVQNPEATLHIRRAPSASTLGIANTTLIIEDSNQTIIHLINNNEDPAYIMSSNEDDLGRSTIEFSSDSAINFRSGSKSRFDPADVTISKNHFLGVGTQFPKTHFHVSAGNSGNTLTLPANRIALFEDDAANYIQLLGTNSSETGIFSGNTDTYIRSGIVFSTDSSIRFRTGGSVTRVTLDNDGRMGIVTPVPQAFLDVNNTFKLGTTGTVNTALKKQTVNLSVGSVPANGELDITVAVAGLATNAAISLTPSDDLPSGIIIAWARPSAANTLKVRFRNLTGGAINPPNIDYQLLVLQ